jgi:hypothetical protein
MGRDIGRPSVGADPDVDGSAPSVGLDPAGDVAQDPRGKCHTELAGVLVGDHERARGNRRSGIGRAPFVTISNAVIGTTVRPPDGMGAISWCGEGPGGDWPGFFAQARTRGSNAAYGVRSGPHRVRSREAPCPISRGGACAP